MDCHREDRPYHLRVRCGDIITMRVFASSSFVVQTVFERSEDASWEIKILAP